MVLRDSAVHGDISGGHVNCIVIVFLVWRETKAMLISIDKNNIYSVWPVLYFQLLPLYAVRFVAYDLCVFVTC